jgi:hypothetical protein
MKIVCNRGKPLKAALSLLLFFLATIAHAAPLDDALTIALDNSASIAAKYAELGIARSGHDWSSDVRFTYNLNNTDTTTTTEDGDITRDSEGVNGRFTLKIPLFSNTTDGKVSKANAAAAVERERVIGAFLTAVKGLVLLHHQHITADESYQLKRDKLDYFKQSVSEGLTESPAELWPHAEAAKQAEHAATTKRLEYQIELETVSRQYGGPDWQQMKAHLQAHINVSKASLKP